MQVQSNWTMVSLTSSYHQHIVLVFYTAKCNLYCRLCNLEFIGLTNELYSKAIINEHINSTPPPKKKKEEKAS